MRDFVILNWCDACFREGEAKVEATQTFTLGVSANENRPVLHVLDLCDSHAEVVQTVRELMANATPVKPEVAPNPPTPLKITDDGFECPVCRSVLAKRSGLVNHIWGLHRQDSRPKGPTACPECGLESATATAIAAHRVAAHHFDAVEEALSGVSGFGRAKLSLIEAG